MEKEKIIEKLLARFKECPSQEFTVRELAEGLKMNDSVSFKFVVQAIAQMEHDKQITLNQNGAFTLAQDNSLPKFTGIFMPMIAALDLSRLIRNNRTFSSIRLKPYLLLMVMKLKLRC